MASNTHTTHVALNAPIPASLTSPSNSADTSSSPSVAQPNTLRTPTHLTPLHGSSFPSLWVTHTQNGIVQTWSPTHTMFSRGNIREKTRLLSLPSVTHLRAPAPSSRSPPPPYTCADLYAGIGYFAFSYARAGASLVLCWELNEWSVEGLIRGVHANGWSIAGSDRVGSGAAIHANAPIPSSTLDELHRLKHTTQTARRDEPSAPLLKPVFLPFHESNVHAARRVQSLRVHIPPVRHVNLGLLPTARDAWGIGLRVLDRELGGWMHVHENVGLAEPEYGERVRGIVGEIARLMREVDGDGDGEEGGGGGADEGERPRLVELEHVEHVKTYAPGVMHCVLDIFIGPKKWDKRRRDEEAVGNDRSR